MPPLADNVVNAPVLGVALPIGVLLMLAALKLVADNVVNEPVDPETQSSSSRTFQLPLPPRRALRGDI